MFKILEIPVKIASFLALLLAAVGFFNPFGIGTFMSAFTAAQVGVKGYVYYGRPVVGASQDADTFYLIRTSGSRDFPHLRYGDLLQSAGQTNFRSSPELAENIIFVLKPENCVVVIENPSVAIARAANGQWRYMDNARGELAAGERIAGGFVRVATTACGLFG